MSAIHSRRVFLAAGPATAVFASLSAAARAEARSPLRELIEAHRRSYFAFEEICGPEDDTDEDDPEYPAIKAEWKRRSRAERKAMDAVCAYPAKTLEEARRKADYLFNHTQGAELGVWQYRALLGSFAA